MLAVDYAVSNPCFREDAALRAVRMLVHVYPLGLSSSLLRNEYTEDPFTHLRRPEEPALARWTHGAGAMPHAAWRAAGAYLRAQPSGYGHDGLGRTAAALIGGRVKAVRAGHLFADMGAAPARVSVLRVFFRAFAGRVTRIAAQQRLAEELRAQGVAGSQGRAFGSAMRLIQEINGVISDEVATMRKLAASGSAAGAAVAAWNRAGGDSPGYRVLGYMPGAPDHSMRPAQAMLRAMDVERRWLLGSAGDGAAGWGPELPRDSAAAFVRTPLHHAVAFG